MSRFTIVSFHAHPDDEALLTGGTLARAAVEGHRVVIVVATGGEAGLAADATHLGRRRLSELERSAAALGAARVVLLGYPDSGSSGTPAPSSFAAIDPAAAARRLARILTEERADVLTTYDATGGYGHPDHVQVHRVGRLAARLAGTPVVLEATIEREQYLRVVGLGRRLSTVLPVPRLPDAAAPYTPRAALTHRVDVRPHLEAKVRALRSHTSQSGGGVRTLALLLRLPRRLRRRVLGTEWFREVGREPGPRLLDDVFASLRDVTLR